MNISIDTLLAIAIGIVGYMAFFNIVTATTGAVLGASVQRIQFGFPPSIHLFRIGRTEVRISPILIAGHVKFAEREGCWDYAPWPVRALIAIAGPVLAIALAFIPLGVQATHEAALAWPQLWTALTDFSSPVNLDTALAPTLQSGGMPAAVAVVVLKVAMFNLLPLPVLNGGAFLIALYEGLTGRSADNLVRPILPISLAMLMAIVVVVAVRCMVSTLPPALALI